MTEEIVPYKPPEISKAVGNLLTETTTLTDKDFYKVGQKMVPSARALQYMANQKHISTKILDWGSDDKRAFAKVAGWIGKENDPTEYKEAIVEINYANEAMAFLVEKALKDPKWKIIRDENGIPTPKEEMHKALMQDFLIRTRKFGIRDCVTKAEAIVNKKLLSVEFRELTEIESEESEVEAVKEQKKARGYSPPKKKDPTAIEFESVPGKPMPKKDHVRSKSISDNLPPINLLSNIKTMEEKRNYLLTIATNPNHTKHTKLKTFLKDRAVAKLKDDEVNGIIQIFKIESQRGK